MRSLVNLGYSLFATKGTHDYLAESGVPSVELHKASTGQHPNVLDSLKGSDLFYSALMYGMSVAQLAARVITVVLQIDRLTWSSTCRC